MSRLLVALLWLIHWLPLSVQAPIGRGIGLLLYWIIAPRRRVVNTNLRLCFPELSDSERRALAKEHFALAGRSLIERGLAWFAPEERIRRLVRIEGAETLARLIEQRQPIIMLTPHFLGLDLGGTRIAADFDCVSIYARQRDPVIDRWLYHGRSRFGSQVLLRRDESVRASIKAMKEIRPFYYLPDMDNGIEDSIFSPFFGVQAATLSALPRLTRLGGAVVITCVTRMLPGGQGYVVTLGEPWTDFPSGDVDADTRRMNACIEDLVRTMPAQYYWVHRRFKTRPPGEPKIY
ncbi:LpxL/LpxP family acyltransferase [Zoogloea dura]|uniref:Lipid A biosynthesis acyltransferase n=1 Tax=Zoogloea dura TaxID=2728840 RepID=A0A848G3K3_9RHOO|nr:lipid A biosynthesis acyltransferase [Zoogloea dura]NML25802.1 lipid A biosynthesis acyltransferase [Zoogloea dura]